MIKMCDSQGLMGWVYKPKQTFTSNKSLFDVSQSSLNRQLLVKLSLFLMLGEVHQKLETKKGDKEGDENVSKATSW